MLVVAWIGIKIYGIQLKELQARRKEVRAEQELKLAAQKREEEEKFRREEAERKAREVEEKRRRLEEAEKKRQAMLQQQRQKNGDDSMDSKKTIGQVSIIDWRRYLNFPYFQVCSHEWGG